MIALLAASLAVVTAGFFVLWWARACRRGTLRRNWVFGYRTLLTLRDDQAWVTVNRAPAPLLTIAAVGVIAGGATALVLTLVGGSAPVPALLGSSIVWLLVWIVASVVAAVRAERRYKQTTTSR